MNDDERDDDAQPEPEPRPKKKKKKRRAAIAAAPNAEVTAAPSGSWTTGHLAAALAAGVALGALGGYGVWGKSASPGEPVAKDSVASQAVSQAPARGAAPPARLQPPQPSPDPGVPVYVPIAAWSPREGPEHAKVTIVEFSDFQ